MNNSCINKKYSYHQDCILNPRWRYLCLQKRTDGKSPKTLKYYQVNPRRILWYADSRATIGFSHSQAHLIAQWRLCYYNIQRKLGCVIYIYYSKY